MPDDPHIGSTSLDEEPLVAESHPGVSPRNHTSKAPMKQAHFFQNVPLKESLQIALVIGGAAGIVNEFSEMNTQAPQQFSPVDLLQQFGLYASCCFLALVFSQKIRFEGLLWNRPQSRFSKLLTLLLYGAVPGILIGLIYTKQFIPFRYSPRVPLWIRLIRSSYDTLIYSLRAAISEELVFRFLLFTGFLYILKKIFQPLIDHGHAIARWIPLLFSILISSLLFGIAHGLFGFANAFLASLVLSLCFLKGGLESAVLCHFIADFVFYNLVYLYTGGLRSL